MKFTPYFILLFITLIVTCFSYIVEYFYPCINNLKNANTIGFFIFRYIHLLSYIYFVSFLFLFNYKNEDAIVYLLFTITLLSTWKIFDCCLLSYYELKMYNVDHRDYLTNFHPCLYVLFRDYQDFILSIMAVIMTFTFYFILIKNKRISIFYKILFFCIYSYIFMDNIIQTRVYNKNLDYPKDNFFTYY